MRAVLQRCNSAQVISDGVLTGRIEKGLVVLLAIHKDDQDDDLQWLLKKILQMRIFSDEAGKMNLSVKDIGGNILLVSQFTLFASTRKGNRPSFINSAPPEFAKTMYERFAENMKMQIPVEEGVFASDMKVSLENDGPVTIIIDSKLRE